ncbi:hypothetical protein Tco_0393537 [Tanacetum coccineum]
MVPRAVLMKSGLVSINTARQNISKGAVLVNTTRQVNDAHSKITVNAARLMSYLSKTTHSTVKRPIHKNIAFKNSNINQRVNIVKDKKINTSRPKAAVNAIKGNNLNGPQLVRQIQDQGVIDIGCLWHMTGTTSYLRDYEEIDGGYVAFGGNPKGGKIIRKGFFVGYSLNSKAFRVFNSRTRIVEENLHIRFSESTPNVVGSGPDWLFDIDALTRIMINEPIVVGTQSNGFAGTKASDNTCQDRKETEPSSHDDVSKPSCDDQEKEDNVNSTNNVNVAGTNEVNAIGGKISIKLPFDPDMPADKCLITHIFYL